MDEVKDYSQDEEYNKFYYNDPNYPNDDIDKKWFELYPLYNTGTLEELSPNEVAEFTSLCKSCFDKEFFVQQRNNPPDAKWLQTALHKGTFQDRTNSGALLIRSNPLPNLSALNTLIGETRPSNNKSPGVIRTLMDLFINCLLPPDRKLISIQHRGADYKNLKNIEELNKKEKDKIYAYWQFENDLKEYYFEFIQNIQKGIQGSQDTVKIQAIISCAKLLTYSPEKEQMLLSMLINKLGDPIGNVAGKALYHLSEVAYNHSNMCGVITNETEKFLFRNNITQKAQHFALCYLSHIAARCAPEVCVKLVQICFSFFKILVDKGEVNSKMMQAILNCLRHAITNSSENVSNPAETEFLSSDTIETIYRIIHIADITISIQALCLLFQVASMTSGNHERFYNVLYKKLIDPNILSLGFKSSTLFFFVIHKAIYLDKNTSRAQAMIKRLLQIALYFPVDKVCASLLVLDKILKSRPELNDDNKTTQHNALHDKLLEKLEDDDDDFKDEKYEDVVENDDFEIVKNIDEKLATTTTTPSWVHLKNTNKIESDEKKNVKIHSNTSDATEYNPFHRNPSFAGGEFSFKSELISFANHFHPSVQEFASNLIMNKPIKYIGDPLVDFSLIHFLDRFSFRNPKANPNNTKVEKTFIQKMHQKTKDYVSFGSRNKHIRSLTKDNCTEEERFIFEFMEQKRLKVAELNLEESRFDLKDDEFEEYLDSLGGKKMPDDSDFLAEIDSLAQSHGNRSKIDDDEDDDEVEWSDDEGNDSVKGKGNESDDDGSISLNEDDIGDDDDDDDDASVMSFSGDEGEKDFNENDFENYDSIGNQPMKNKSKLSKKPDISENLTAKMFDRKLKANNDLSSLFVAADDFAEILEETGKNKTHGTIKEIYNKDKSSEKQMKWEDSRRNSFKRKRNNNKPRNNSKPKYGKKNKK